MHRNKKIIRRPLVLLLFLILVTACEKNDLPTTVNVLPNDFYGEWKGTTISTRSLSGMNIIETPAALPEIMSLRQENGKDTFNFKDPATGINIAGRQGTWYVTQVNNSEDDSLSGARILKLRVVSSATRIVYTTLTIKQNDAKILVLNDGANKTLTYNR